MILVVTMLTTFLSVKETSAQTTQTFTANGTFTVPAGVTSIKVECWGGGGAGGAAQGNPSAGGGGGGGSYVRNNAITVVPGQSYTVTVGAGGLGVNNAAGPAGGDSWFGSVSTILAKGGNGGARATANNTTASGATAVTTGNVGSTSPYSYYGGAGGTGGANGASGGGGGSSAGTGSSGNPGIGVNAGAAVTGGGAGVAGSTNSADGADNTNLGGGGAGARAGNNTDRAGGNGGNGKVVITYICTISGVAATPSSSIVCAGSPINLTGAPAGSTVIGSEGFEGTGTPIWTSTAGSILTGNSLSTSSPALSPYYSSGTKGWGIGGVNGTITFNNITGLGAYASNKKVSFKLATFGEDATLNKGVESDDNLTVRISLNGGTTYSQEIQITGWGTINDADTGAYWPFLPVSSVASVTYDGNNTLEAANIKAPAGPGLRSSEAYGTVVVNLPDNATQVMVQLVTNTNNVNEKWVIDDFKVFSGASTNGNNLTYSWSANPLGYTSSLQSPTNLTPSVTTAYTLTVSDGVCSSTAVANVTVNPLPTITGASELFVASTTDLSGSGTAAASNAWVSSDPSKITVDAVSGRLFGKAIASSPINITYTDNNGCQKTQSMTVVSSPLVQYFLALLTSAPTDITTNRQIPYPSATYFTEGGVKKLRLRLPTGSTGVTINSIYRDLDGNGSTTDVPQGSDDLLAGSSYTTSTSGGITIIDIPLNNIKSVGNTIYNIFIKTTKGGNTFVNYLSLSSAALLPVTLTSFTAKPAPNRTVSLNWATSSETVNKGFRIERQAGNITGKYESLGFVSSKANGGNSQVDLYYNFMDVNPRNEETSYYRLAQEDLDGKTTYSEVRVVKLSGQTVSMVYPNPSNGAVNISRNADGRKMNIQVMDMSGRMIQQFTNITDANYRLNISKSGMYNIKMSYPETGEQTTQRIVIER